MSMGLIQSTEDLGRTNRLSILSISILLLAFILSILSVLSILGSSSLTAFRMECGSFPTFGLEIRHHLFLGLKCWLSA